MVVRRSAALAAALALALAACHGGNPDLTPVAEDLTPGAGYAGSETRVAILGGPFHVRATQSAAGPQENAVDATYQAWLGDTGLRDVRWVDEGRIECTVPATLAAGVYPLRLVGPYAAEAQLEAAFTVVPAPAASPGPAATPAPGATPWPAATPAPGPSLTVAYVLAPKEVRVGDRFSLVVTIRNGGGGAAAGVAPTVTALGAGRVTAAGPADPATGLGAGASALYAVPYRAAAAGTVLFQVAATGTDPADASPLGSATSTAAVVVQPPEHWN